MTIFILKEDFFLLTKIFLISPFSYAMFNSNYSYPIHRQLLYMLNSTYSKYCKIYFSEYCIYNGSSLWNFELKFLRSLADARNNWLSSQTLPSQHNNIFFKLVIE